MVFIPEDNAVLYLLQTWRRNLQWSGVIPNPVLHSGRRRMVRMRMGKLWRWVGRLWSKFHLAKKMVSRRGFLPAGWWSRSLRLFDLGEQTRLQWRFHNRRQWKFHHQRLRQRVFPKRPKRSRRKRWSLLYESSDEVIQGIQEPEIYQPQSGGLSVSSEDGWGFP